MPLALIILAAFLILTGIKGNYAAVGTQFENDVMGSGGFLEFFIGIVGIAAFFRLIDMPNAGKVFLILVLLAYFLENQSVLTSLESLGASMGSTTTTGASTGSAGTNASTTSATALPGATAPSSVGTIFAPTSGPGSSGQ
jgi:hypothetical protein